PDTDVCSTWSNVVCSRGYVSSLNLEDKGLIGSIPSQIGDLLRLSSLSFGGNSLAGSLPSSLWTCTNLVTVTVDRNQLTGPIPSGQLHKVGKLKVFLGQSNSFSGKIPSVFGFLTRLAALDLRLNSFTGTIPASLGKLLSLERLGLSDNQLTGSIPEALCALSSLDTQIDVTGNGFF
ncbi:unnamed protein product, partial [Ectocarpus fasciculatus]